MEQSDKEDWVIILNSNERIDINIKRMKLEDTGIPCILLDHQDSMLMPLNTNDLGLALCVKRIDKDNAIQIIGTE